MKRISVVCVTKGLGLRVEGLGAYGLCSLDWFGSVGFVWVSFRVCVFLVQVCVDEKQFFANAI